MNAQAMQAAPLQPQARSVYGLTIQDPRLAALTRRVLCISTISAIIVIASNVYYMMTRESGFLPTVVNVALALLVPACGYFGARNSDKNLTCCFCGCNFLSACCALLGIVLALVSLRASSFILDNCDPADPSSSCPSNWESVCQGRHEDTSAQECYDWIHHNVEHLRIGVYTLAIAGAPTILLNCLAFCWGKQLYDELRQGHVLHQVPGRFPMDARMVQPQAM